MKTLYVFDMDGTLVSLPKLTDILVIKNGRINSGDSLIDNAANKVLELSKKVYEEENEGKRRSKMLAGIKNDFSFKRKGDFIVMLHDGNELGKKYIQDIQDSINLSDREKKEILNKLVIENRDVALGLFSEFFRTEATVGTEMIKPVVNLYKKIENKMILTGRSNVIKKGVEYVLFNIIGLPKPNFGLYMYDNSKGGVAQFKAKTIEESIEKYKWEQIYFFDDRGDWLESTKEHINKIFPQVKFHTKEIKSEKNKHQL